ncbi:hypothetical protein N9216_01910, partial [Pseudomonadales bacterium]|nr:hypothetical protein [Pseudomonadales bacterium]
INIYTIEMKGSKSSRVDLLEKKIEALIRVVQQILDENNYLKDLAVGTLETVKNIEGYEQAIEKLKEKVVAESGQTEEAITGGKIIE